MHSNCVIDIHVGTPEDLSMLSKFVCVNGGGYEISDESWRQYLNDDVYDVIYVADSFGSVIGLCIYMFVIDTVDIIFIVTSLNNRRIGLGRRLLLHVLEITQTSKICIDVSEKNVSAIQFYKKMGFEFISRRKKYYDGSDALVGVLRISNT